MSACVCAFVRVGSILKCICGKENPQRLLTGAVICTQIQFFKDSHHITRASRLLIDGFSQDEVDNNVVVYLAWGLKERNLSSCESSQLDCLGHPVYDDNFNASTEAAQQAFVVCTL